MLVEWAQFFGGVKEDPLPLVIEDNGHPRRKELVLIRGGPVVEGELSVFIGQEIEFEILVVLELPILSGSVERDPDDLDAEGIEVSLSVAEPATFVRSASCGGCGVKPQDRPRPKEALAFEGLGVLVNDGAKLGERGVTVWWNGHQVRPGRFRRLSHIGR